MGQEILIVDDQPYNLFVFEEMISLIKEVKLLEKALNGEQALEHIEMRLQQRRKCYDLIIIDLNMPVMDGIQLVSELRKRQKEGLINLDGVRLIAASAIDIGMFKEMKNAKMFDGFGKFDSFINLVEKPIRE